MAYGEMKKNQYGYSYRFLETIGDREYWQISDSVLSALVGAEKLNDGTPEESWPSETREECAFSEWKTHRPDQIRLLEINPIETKRRYMTMKKDWSGTKIVHDQFLSVGSMMEDSRIVDLFVLTSEYRNTDDSLTLWSGYGTDLLLQVCTVRKSFFRRLSEENINALLNLTLTTDSLAKYIADYFDGSKKSWFLIGCCMNWLQTVGYDTTELERKWQARKARDAEAKQKKQQEEEQREQEHEAKIAAERRESAQMIRERIMEGKEIIISYVYDGPAILVELFEQMEIPIPLRTKGWIYGRLYSITGDGHSFSGKGKGSSKFSQLLGKLRKKLREQLRECK